MGIINQKLKSIEWPYLTKVCSTDGTSYAYSIIN